ncbi:hypothetical protein [Pseudoalteromonas nigrifaciens]|uniref:hypothetical protein n=1 Tax=Pseudoalteromonas nigrifaciens TaxID=28109 RepID=UPI003569A9FC
MMNLIDLIKDEDNKYISIGDFIRLVANHTGNTNDEVITYIGRYCGLCNYDTPIYDKPSYSSYFTESYLGDFIINSNNKEEDYPLRTMAELEKDDDFSKLYFLKDDIFNAEHIKVLNLKPNYEKRQATVNHVTEKLALKQGNKKTDKERIAELEQEIEDAKNTGSFSMGTPTVAYSESETNEQLINELEAANDQIARLKSQLEQSTTDRRSYTTPAMNIMDKVITEFWLDYNPNQSAPKQEIIVRWITGNFDGVSKALALNIDKVCRHSEARSGGKYKR